MRRRSCFGAAILAVGACIILAPAARADQTDTPESLLQEAAKQHKYCLEPQPTWNRKTQSSDFDSCNDEALTLIKAIELSKKDPKIVEAAAPSLTAAKMNMARASIFLGNIYIMREDLGSAVGFFSVACTPFKDISSLVKPTEEQVAAMKAIRAEAEDLLQGDHRSCKELLQP